MSIVVKNLERSENIRTFLDRSFRSSETLPTVVIGRGIYNPGWRWSLHAGKQTGKASMKHIGYVLSGTFVVQDASGVEKTVGAGEAFEVGPGHDAWVVGNEPCVALDFNSIKELVE